MNIVYKKVNMPPVHTGYAPVILTKETMESHRRQVLLRMEEKGLDALLVYADREHGANYAYLTGFEPRFEESVLILYRDGSCRLMLGNENLKMCGYSFIKAQPVHVPHFSLPYQPMDTDKSLPELFDKAGLADGMRIGCAGWKWFTSRHDENGQMLDIPSFIVDAVRRLCPDSVLTNAADIFLDPARGLRIFSSANEIAHYEFGAGLASSQILCALNSVQPGKTEMEIAGEMNCLGQPMTVTMICAAGDRFTDAVVFPRNKKICLGDKFSLTLGLRGGLTSRAAYVAYQREDLAEEVRDYLERAAMPYYRMAVSWYEAVSIGTKCGEIYRMAEELLPREQYHWTLNPGHSTGADEWVSSPMYPGSEVILQSGMMLQMDVIPSVPGYGGANAEDGIAIADEKLRAELREKYPAVWKRMQDRREYMERELGIRLKEEILPLSDLCGYMRPYILNHDYALAKGE